MTMIENHPRLGAMTFDHLPPYTGAPAFHNPWASAPAPASAVASAHHPHPSLYTHHPTAQNLTLGIKTDLPPAAHPASAMPPRLQGMPPAMSPYAAVPPTSNPPAAAPAGPGMSLSGMSNAGHGAPPLTHLPDLLAPSRSLSTASGYTPDDVAYSNAPSPVHHAYAPATPSSATSFDPAAYLPSRPAPHSAAYGHPHSAVSSVSSYEDTAERMAERMHRPPSLAGYGDPPPHGLSHDATHAFAEHVQQANRGMLSMPDDPTPRNIYGDDRRGSADSYGFPNPHSSASSVASSSVGDYPSYMSHSVASSVSDYSAAGSDVESLSTRTLPRPGMYYGAIPPAPQSMMNQFSSKLSSSTTKKHKCKVCDKRFTRPSSLQTHMYSHTGEKPFVCEVDGCGRHFSVVSNLRRHRKVHKGEARSDAGSDHHSVDDDE